MDDKRVSVFVRIFANDLDRSLKWQMRRGFIDAVVARWKMFEGIKLGLLIAGNDAPASTFHIDSKRLAERLASSGIYVIADDDCLPIGKDFVEKGVSEMLRWKAGIFSAASISDGDVPPTALDGPIERLSVGGIVFVRRGILKEFPPCTPDHVDETICNEIRKHGHKVGVLPHVKFNHLAAYFSTTSKGEHNWQA